MNEHPEPRRALPEEGPHLRKPLLALGAGLAVAAVAGGTFLALQSGNEAAGNAPGRGCPKTATLLVDPAWVDSVREAADAWGRSADGDGCHPVEVTPQLSAVVARDGVGDADGWIPEDLSVQQGATDAGLRQLKATTLGTSPLVLVNTPEAGEALKGGLQGETLRRMVTLDETWANHGHKEWGWFKLVLPNPDTTASGAAAFASLMGQAGRGTTPPTNPVTATPDQRNMAKVEQRIVARTELTDVLNSLASNPADENGRTPAGPRTGVTTLTLALRSGGLQASYLDTRTGLTMALANATGHDTLKSFATWLGTGEGSRALAMGGVTTRSAAPAQDRVAALGLPVKAPTVVPLAGKDLQASRMALQAFSKRTSALMVLDTSGSMQEPLGPGGPRRIDAVTRLALGSSDSCPPGMVNGLITFNSSDDAAQTPNVRTVIPLERDTTKEWAAARPKYQQALMTMRTGGGTPLYQAIATAWRYNTTNYQAGLDNRIFVITDGRDEDAKGSLNWQQLMEVLPKEPDPERPIKVTYVALGPDADFAALQKIAQATNQTAMQVNSVDELQTKMTLLVAG